MELKLYLIFFNNFCVEVISLIYFEACPSNVKRRPQIINVYQVKRVRGCHSVERKVKLLVSPQIIRLSFL